MKGISAGVTVLPLTTRIGHQDNQTMEAAQKSVHLQVGHLVEHGTMISVTQPELLFAKNKYCFIILTFH